MKLLQLRLSKCEICTTFLHMLLVFVKVSTMSGHNNLVQSFFFLPFFNKVPTYMFLFFCIQLYIYLPQIHVLISFSTRQIRYMIIVSKVDRILIICKIYFTCKLQFACSSICSFRPLYHHDGLSYINQAVRTGPSLLYLFWIMHPQLLKQLVMGALSKRKIIMICFVVTNKYINLYYSPSSQKIQN